MIARLPAWAIGELLFLLFVVLPCVSLHLGPDEFTAALDTAAAARDVERSHLFDSIPATRVASKE